MRVVKPLVVADATVDAFVALILIPRLWERAATLLSSRKLQPWLVRVRAILCGSRLHVLKRRTEGPRATAAAWGRILLELLTR